VKSEKSQVSNEVNEWFNWARKQRIVIGMTNGFYTPEGEAVKLEEMIAMYPLGE